MNQSEVVREDPGFQSYTYAETASEPKLPNYVRIMRSIESLDRVNDRLEDLLSELMGQPPIDRPDEVPIQANPSFNDFLNMANDAIEDKAGRMCTLISEIRNTVLR